MTEKSDLKLPLEEIVCKQIEDKVISYSDLFFSKNPSKIFNESSAKKVREKIKSYGSRQEQIFELWHNEFAT